MAASSIPSGNVHGGQFGEPVPLGGEQLEAELDEALLESGPAGGVASPGLLEPFVEYRAETGVETEDHRDGSGVVIGAAALAIDVGRDEREVEVPALRLLDEALTGADPTP